MSNLTQGSMSEKTRLKGEVFLRFTSIRQE